MSLKSTDPKGQSSPSEPDEYLASGARTNVMNFRTPSQPEDVPSRALFESGGDAPNQNYTTEISAAHHPIGPI